MLYDKIFDYIIASIVALLIIGLLFEFVKVISPIYVLIMLSVAFSYRKKLI